MERIGRGMGRERKGRRGKKAGKWVGIEICMMHRCIWAFL
jgi:hypothetical protein